jgi:hypothetical protein
VWRFKRRAEPQPNCECPIVLEHTGSRRERVQRCRSTDETVCPQCGRSYRIRVYLVAETGRMRFPGATVLLLTLTAPSEKGRHCQKHKGCAGYGERCEPCPCSPDDGVHLGEWNGSASANWNRFIEDFRRLVGVDVQYFRAAEVQKRGALHFHVLIRLPKSCGINVSLPRLRQLAIHHGFGHSVDLQAVHSERAASYVAKYASKSCATRKEMPWVHRRTGEVSDGYRRYRVWTSSRQWGCTMADVRAAQAAWWREGDRKEPAEPATAGPLDPRSQSYESGMAGPCDGGRL